METKSLKNSYCSRIFSDDYQAILQFIASNIQDSISILVRSYNDRNPKYECTIIFKSHFNLHL